MFWIKLVEMSTIFYCTRLRLSKCDGLRVVSIKQNVNYSFQPPSTFVFSVFHNGLTRSCTSFADLSAHIISHVDLCNVCICLRSSNVRHFGMVEAAGLNSMASRSPSVAWTPYWIPQKSTICSKVTGGRRSDREPSFQTGRMVISS
jgi:hypothetical protein